MLDAHARNIMPRLRKRGAFHDERILAIRVVPRPHAKALEPERGVKRLRALVACAHLERARLRPEAARVGRDATDKLAGDTATAKRGVDAHLEYLHVPVDNPAAGISDEGRILGDWQRRIGGVRRPPDAVSAPELVGDKRRAPRIASHDVALHGGDG